MIEVSKLSSEEWKSYSEDAHKIAFKEIRPASWDRIDYALLGTELGILYGYLTARELDAKSVYWQYGGAFPPSMKSPKAVKGYGAFIQYARERYDRITTLVENENITYLKLAFAFGFRVIGVRCFENKIYCELLLDFKKEEI